MVNLPDTPEALFAAIPDEEAARRYLVNVRWPDGVRCSACCSARVVQIGTRPDWWRCRDCKHHTSLRSQSILHGSRMPLLDWIYVMWAVAHPLGPSVLEAARFLGRRYATLFAMFHKVRAAVAERAGYELSGDEVYVGFGWFPPAKLGLGDPPDHRRVLVAVVGKGEPYWYFSKELRCSSLGEVYAPAQVLDQVLEAHVAPGTVPIVEVRPPVWEQVNSAAHAVRRPFLQFLGWTQRRFTGVSRRYLGNYLAQFVYLVNRYHRRERLLDWVARRAMEEIFRPAAESALEPLVRPPRQQLAA